MSEPRPFITCKYCREVIDLTRAGSAGVKGKRDSHQVKCGACGRMFFTKGETWKEAHGGVR